MPSGNRHRTDGTGPGLHPPLRPPGYPPDSSTRASASHRWIWMALAVVLLLGLLVVLVLPRLVSVPSGVSRQPAEAQVAAAGESAAARTAAEQGLQQFLRLQARLEPGNAAIWGAPAWDEAAALAASGDRLFGARRFIEAARAYADALHRLEQLEGRKQQIFDQALEAGQSALEADDPDVAQQHLELALAVEPGHDIASRSLARAQARRSVLQHMAAGAVAENAGDLEAAGADYAAALQLDSEYQPARDTLERVSEQLTDTRFRAAMSRALVALDSGKLNEAGEALDNAARLRSDADAVRDARLRLTRARQQSSLSQLRRKATAAVREEDWQGAAALYKKALQIDANAGFARSGLEQARARIQLHRQFDHYLDDPQRLYSAEPLENAQTLLSSVGRAPAAEPRLAEKINRLAQQVAAALVPVQVRLRSDGETEVVIYHVARLGRFVEHRLELRPGTYTAVGSRPGYRDVRKVFSVSPGQVPAPVDIRCEEPV
ncbi:MAG: tetratricopeptide repeat protein [Thiogranum sp.]